MVKITNSGHKTVKTYHFESAILEVKNSFPASKNFWKWKPKYSHLNEFHTLNFAHFKILFTWSIDKAFTLLVDWMLHRL